RSSACAARARVTGGASILVVACTLVVREDAARRRIAGVRRTHVVVAADAGRARLTGASGAYVAHGAGIAVRASGGVVRVGASRGRVAGVRRAHVVVGAAQRGARVARFKSA